MTKRRQTDQRRKIIEDIAGTLIFNGKSRKLPGWEFDGYEPKFRETIIGSSIAS